MSAGVRRLLARVGRGCGGVRVRTEEVPGGILRVVMSSRSTRANGIETAIYLAGSILARQLRPRLHSPWDVTLLPADRG